MKRVASSLLLPLLLVAATMMSGCVMDESSSLELVSISTDKTVYHSQEQIHINVSIKTSQPRANVTVDVKGLQSQKETRGYQLTASTTTNLEDGLNIVAFSERLPSCSSCAGLYPGDYNITVTVSQDDEVLLTGTHAIEFQN